MKSQYCRGQLRALPFFLAWLAAAVGFIFSPSATCGVIAAILFLIAAAIAVQDHLLARYGCRAQGIVVDHVEEEEAFFPVIEYRDAKGEMTQQKTTTGMGVKRPPVGAQVVVIYDPTGKRGCEIDTFLGRWGVALFVAALGCFFLLGIELAH